MAEAILVKCGFGNTSTLLFQNVQVQVSYWKEDTTYVDYPFKAEIPCEGITENHFPEVILSLTDANSGQFAPICNTSAGFVYIWAYELPQDIIEIPLIRATLLV